MQGGYSKAPENVHVMCLRDAGVVLLDRNEYGWSYGTDLEGMTGKYAKPSHLKYEVRSP